MGQPKQPRKNVNKQFDQFNGFSRSSQEGERQRESTMRETLERERESSEPHLFCARAATKLARALSFSLCRHGVCTLFWPPLCFNLVSLSVRQAAL